MHLYIPQWGPHGVVLRPCRVCGIRARCRGAFTPSKSMKDDTYPQKTVAEVEENEIYKQTDVSTMTYCHHMHLWSPRISQTLPCYAQAPRVFKNI